MRAGRYDITIETGTLFSREVRWLEPTAAIPASTVVVGQRIYLSGWPMTVYSVTPLANNQIRIIFGHGLWNDPTVQVDAAALVVPAIPLEILDATAVFHVQETEPPEDVLIPVTVAVDGMTAILELDSATDLSAYAGAHSWDLYLQSAEYDWQRVLEGTATIIQGDAR